LTGHRKIIGVVTYISHQLLFPKARMLKIIPGRSSDSLLFGAFPFRSTKQWRKYQKSIWRFTAAGTVPEFHRIPFSSVAQKMQT